MGSSGFWEKTCGRRTLFRIRDVKGIKSAAILLLATSLAAEGSAYKSSDACELYKGIIDGFTEIELSSKDIDTLYESKTISSFCSIHVDSRDRQIFLSVIVPYKETLESEWDRRISEKIEAMKRYAAKRWSQKGSAVRNEVDRSENRVSFTGRYVNDRLEEYEQIDETWIKLPYGILKIRTFGDPKKGNPNPNLSMELITIDESAYELPLPWIGLIQRIREARLTE